MDETTKFKQKLIMTGINLEDFLDLEYMWSTLPHEDKESLTKEAYWMSK